MAGKISGFAVAYTAFGGLLLYSGIKGTTLSNTFKDLASGQLDSTEDQKIGSPSLNILDQAGGSSGSGSGSSPSGSTPAGDATPANSSESAWIKALLSDLGAPDSAANVSSFTNWIREEDGGWTQPSGGAEDKGGNWNPFNSTQHESGSTTYNSDGVQNYPTETEGISATIATLQNGLYPNIIMALKQGVGLATGNSAVEAELKTWSTGSPDGSGGYSSV